MFSRGHGFLASTDSVSTENLIGPVSVWTSTENCFIFHFNSDGWLAVISWYQRLTRQHLVGKLINSNGIAVT